MDEARPGPQRNDCIILGQVQLGVVSEGGVAIEWESGKVKYIGEEIMESKKGISHNVKPVLKGN